MWKIHPSQVKVSVTKLETKALVVELGKGQVPQFQEDNRSIASIIYEKRKRMEPPKCKSMFSPIPEPPINPPKHMQPLGVGAAALLVRAAPEDVV